MSYTRTSSDSRAAASTLTFLADTTPAKFPRVFGRLFSLWNNDTLTKEARTFQRKEPSRFCANGSREDTKTRCFERGSERTARTRRSAARHEREARHFRSRIIATFTRDFLRRSKSTRGAVEMCVMHRVATDMEVARSLARSHVNGTTIREIAIVKATEVRFRS